MVSSRGFFQRIPRREHSVQELLHPPAASESGSSSCAVPSPSEADSTSSENVLRCALSFFPAFFFSGMSQEEASPSESMRAMGPDARQRFCPCSVAVSFCGKAGCRLLSVGRAAARRVGGRRRDPARPVEDDALFHDEPRSGDVAQDEAGGQDDHLLRGDDFTANHSAHDDGARVQRAFRPAVLANEHLAPCADDAGEISVNAQQAVQVELALELVPSPMMELMKASSVNRVSLNPLALPLTFDPRGRG